MGHVQRTLQYYGRAALRKWGFSVVALALALILALGSIKRYSIGGNQDFFEIARLKTLFSWRGIRAVPDDVVIAAIDGAAVSQLANGARIFPRKFAALALKKIIEARPRAVILDVRAGVDPTDPASDEQLEHALAAGPTSLVASEPYVEGATFCGRKSEYSPSESDPRFLNAAKVKISMSTLETFGYRMKISSCDDSSMAASRRAPLIIPLTELGGYEVTAPGLRDLINFYGPADTIPKFSLAKIINDDPATIQRYFQNKVVLFGYLFEENRGMKNNESFLVPAGTRMFGVEIHASIAANLLDGSWIRRMSLQSELIFIFLSILFLSSIGLRLVPEKGVVMVLGFVLFLHGAAYVAFIKYYFLLPGISVIQDAAQITVLISGILHYRHIKTKWMGQSKLFGINR